MSDMFVPVADDVPTRDAATVVLVRDGVDGLEVFLQHRASSMAFAPGMTVFPGGGVDASDADVPQRWFGPDTTAWADTLTVEPERAIGWIGAAVRETFEECGVLLAGSSGQDVVTDTGPLNDARRTLGRQGTSLAALLDRHGLGVRSDLLVPLARWVTPRGERRRYDTMFFGAVLPDRQQADADNTEVTTADWQTPQAALADWAAGRVILLPPTWSVLTELATKQSAEEVVASPGDVAPLEPRLVESDSGWRVDFPGGEAYFRDLPSTPRSPSS